MTPLAVPQIDFLPASYRQRSAKQRDRLWRFATAGLGLALLAAAWFYRHSDAAAVQAEFDSYRPRYDAAVATKERWAVVQKRLAEAEIEAELVTFLRHPWPTTRMLAAVIPPIPDSITLTEVKVVQETIAAPDAASRRSVGAKPDVAQQQRPAAERDLEQLQLESNRQRTVLLLAGETADGDELHRYIGQLPTSAVVQRAELLSLQNNAPDKPTPGSKRASQFQARVVIRRPLTHIAEPAEDNAPRIASGTTP